MATSPATAEPFAFPREYNFPPFFTRQTNLTTRHAQLTKWSALVLAYARHHRIFRLALSSAAETDLFHNKAISRRLQPADIRDLFEFMRKDGRADYVSEGAQDVVYVYWKTIDEWAAAVEAFVDQTAHKGSILTLYELSEGDATLGTGTFGHANRLVGWLTSGCRTSRNRRRCSPESTECACQTRQGTDLWTRGLARCQVLLKYGLSNYSKRRKPADRFHARCDSRTLHVEGIFTYITSTKSSFLSGR